MAEPSLLHDFWSIDAKYDERVSAEVGCYNFWYANCGELPTRSALKSESGSSYRLVQLLCKIRILLEGVVDALGQMLIFFD